MFRRFAFLFASRFVFMAFTFLGVYIGSVRSVPDVHLQGRYNTVNTRASLQQNVDNQL
jgi:hypothetical protein